MTAQILALLVAERDRLTRAIEALQGPAKLRGCPPKAQRSDDNTSHVPDGVKPRNAVPALRDGPKLGFVELVWICAS